MRHSCTLTLPVSQFGTPKPSVHPALTARSRICGVRVHCLHDCDELLAIAGTGQMYVVPCTVLTGLLGIWHIWLLLIPLFEFNICLLDHDNAKVPSVTKT